MPRTRAAFDDDEDIETRPRRHRAFDDEDEGPQRPRESARSSFGDDSDELDEGVGHKRQRDGAKEDKPSRIDASRRHTAAAGWDEFEKNTGSSDKADFEAKNNLRLKVTNDPQLIKVLDPAPFDSMGQHWVQEIKSGKRSFRCLGDNCPLCEDLDHYARKLAYLNVALLDEKSGDWENRVWEVGVKLGRKLRKIGEDEKRGPINNPNLYFSISKTGVKTSTEYHLDLVKARDLEDDWDIDPIDEKTYQRLSASRYTEPWERFSKEAELRRVVSRLLDEDTDDEYDD
ncbi:hypothetical protein [Streptomyces sp. WZ-12]|uniref:hypothetical protein n=1 Tax=Streptomyces sp. WZ-12 TaxID=3030210 RepID=UPI0023813713|nr:hypothetical protein [Streptomyces sp. WZ-12]